MESVASNKSFTKIIVIHGNKEELLKIGDLYSEYNPLLREVMTLHMSGHPIWAKGSYELIMHMPIDVRNKMIKDLRLKRAVEYDHKRNWYIS